MCTVTTLFGAKKIVTTENNFSSSFCSVFFKIILQRFTYKIVILVNFDKSHLYICPLESGCWDASKPSLAKCKLLIKYGVIM